jgi:glutathione S-transferase
MSEDIVFWGLPPSSNSAVVRSFLLASGISFKESNAWGQTRTPEYIAKFPNNAAPSLENGDVYVTESVTVMRYLCRAFPEKAGKFYSDDAKQAAKIDMVCDMINTGICGLIPKAIYPTLGFPAYPGDVAAMDDTKEFTAKSQKEAADAIETALNDKYVGIFLANTKYLLSDTPTMADFRFAPMLSQIKVAVKLPAKIEEYLEAMNAIDGFAEGMKPSDEFCAPHWKKE